MTIHVKIAEAKAKAKPSNLVKAGLRGEELLIDRDGKSQVRLTPVAEAQQIDREERARKLDRYWRGWTPCRFCRTMTRCSGMKPACRYDRARVVGLHCRHQKRA